MALKATLSFLLLGNLPSLLAAPAHDNLISRSMMRASSLVTQKGGLHLWKQKPFPVRVDTGGVEPLLLLPIGEPYPTSTAEEGQSSSYLSPSTALMTSTMEEQAKTVTIIDEVPITITVTSTPNTITETITTTESSVPSTSTMPSATTPTEFGLAKSIWVAPSDLSDLSSFQISKFSSGKDNLEIVSDIPAHAKTPQGLRDASITINEDDSSLDDTSHAMRLLYPAGSIDPAQKPQGGAQFYASPIDISDARNVTLRYSVLFPANFDWVMAGKLPGLYGGHTGCSGGNAAIDCFSTRLMWRQNGIGELYLYAPKDKQTKALCSDELSVCDAAYGLSVGRGSFSWKAGRWTTIHQTIYLNTPGQQDGAFTLDVDGKTVISRSDVFYRGDLSSQSENKGKSLKMTKAPSRATSTRHAKPKPTSTDGGLLDPILGGLLGDLGLRRILEIDDDSLQATTTPGSRADMQPATTTSPKSTVTSSQSNPTLALKGPSETGMMGTEAAMVDQVKFAGIFFSTFFGGHEDKYATPRDQYVWFRDFALAYNS